MKIEMPKPVEWIIDKLNGQGYQAYAVGGCVRDTMIGKAPEDWDITTSAQPAQVKAIFGRTIDTGIAHGTVTVIRQHVGYEITTYRIDGSYEDGRHPKQVEYTGDLLEDLRRRDFTINAMAYHHKRGIVDSFGGIADLRRGLIRCVGRPEERFSEDALRILRAIRFSAQLGFEIEEETRNAIEPLAPNLVHISKERIQMELTKLLLSEHPERVRLVFETGISPYITPGFHQLNLNEIQMDPVLSGKKHLRWAALLWPLGEKDGASVLTDLKMDKDTIVKTATLIRWRNQPILPDKAEIRKVMSRIPAELYLDLLEWKQRIAPQLQCADTIERVVVQSCEILADGDCLGLKELAVTGQDLIGLGMKPGKKIGDTLQSLLGLVLLHPEWNTKERLLEELKAEPVWQSTASGAGQEVCGNREGLWE